MSLFVFNNGECEYCIYHRQTDKQTDVGPNIKKLPDLIRKHSSIMYKSRTLISIRFQQNKNLAGKSLEQ